MSEQKLSLLYFGVKARSAFPLVAAGYAGLDLEWNKDVDWPAMKASTPMGQLPVLTVSGPKGDVVISQSMAIFRFIARRGGLIPEDDADYARCEMMIEAGNEVFELLAKAKYGGGWDKALAENEQLPNKLAALEKLLAAKPEGSRQSFSSAINAGDIAVFTALNVALDPLPTALDSYPLLKAFYDNIGANPGVAKAVATLDATKIYFARE